MYKSKNYYTLAKSKYKNKITWGYYAYDEEGTRVRRSTGAKTRSEAIKVIEERIQTDTLIYPIGTTAKRHYKPGPVPKGITMDEFCANLFIYEKCPIVADAIKRGRHIAKSTCMGRRGMLQNYILPVFGKMRVSEITPRVVDEWLLDMPDRYGISRTSANERRGVLSIVMDYAVKKEIIDRNPCKEVSKLGSDTKEKTPFTEEDIMKLFGTPWKSRLAEDCCYLSANTGMRRGEIIALQGYQVHENYIEIDSSFSHIAKERKCTKNGKTRYVPISSKIYNILKPYIREPNDYLFTNDGERPVSITFIGYSLKEEIKRHGIEKEGLSFHSFRHYFNTRLIASGVDDEKVRAVIGHESKAMTEHYLHLTAGDMMEITELQG